LAIIKNRITFAANFGSTIKQQ